MAWECAVCNKREGDKVRIEAVCHHCGKPLCADDRVLVLDLDFSGEDGPLSRNAFHCAECSRRYHAGLPEIARQI